MVKTYRTQKYTPMVLITVIFCSFVFYAYSTGITGVTLKNGDGCICHAATPNSSVSVVISGPDSVQINHSGVYTVTISGGPLTRGGTNIAASNGSIVPVNSDLQIIGGELTHIAPKLPSGGTVTFQFTYTAPATVGNQTIFANGNSVNFNGSNEGDMWNFASNKTIVVIPEVPVELTSFTASVSGTDITLNWTTATETNNYGFEVLRSNDQTSWERSAFIYGAGNSISTITYSYVDRNLWPGEYYYRIKQIDFNGSFEYFMLDEMIKVYSPSDFTLSQNYPNPFNPSTRIAYSIPVDGNVQLTIFNPLGREVAELVNGFTQKGNYNADFSAGQMSSGVYYYELKLTDMNSNTYSSIKKMILIK